MVVITVGIWPNPDVLVFQVEANGSLSLLLLYPSLQVQMAQL